MHVGVCVCVGNNIVLPDILEALVMRYYVDNDRVSMIKLTRTLTGFGLLEAKLLCDYIIEHIINKDS